MTTTSSLTPTDLDQRGLPRRRGHIRAVLAMPCRFCGVSAQDRSVFISDHRFRVQVRGLEPSICMDCLELATEVLCPTTRG